MKVVEAKKLISMTNYMQSRYMSKNDPDVEPEAVMEEEELDPVSLMDVEPYLDWEWGVSTRYCKLLSGVMLL